MPYGVAAILQHSEILAISIEFWAFYAGFWAFCAGFPKNPLVL